MTTIAAPPSALPVPPVPVWRFTVDEYHHMIATGLLTSDDSCELLDGWIVPTMPANPPHYVAIKKTELAVERVLPPGWHTRTQAPLTTDDSEPEPDIAVVRGRIDDYLSQHPGSPDTALVVEVSDSTLSSDRRLKARIYARAAIPEYWIVNLVDDCIEVHSDPTGSADAPEYRTRTVHRPGGEFGLMLDGAQIAQLTVADLLP